MTDIFVSYSRKDEAFGRKLHSRLTGMKRNVWMDWEDIPFSSDWWTEIKRGIETSDNFLIILTPDFVSSPVCMLEVDYARQNNKRILIISHNFKEASSGNSSILLQRTKESDVIQGLLGDRDIVIISRENWRSIGHVHWLFFNDDKTFEVDFRNLIDTLDTDLEHVRSHTTLQVRALDWFENDRNWSFLLTGVQIDQAELWLKTAIDEAKEPQPTALHSEFIKASRSQQDEQEQSVLKMQNRAKRLRQAAIIAGVIAAIILIFGIGITFWAEGQARTANEKVSNANDLLASVGETLTPIGATLESAEIAKEEAQLLANNAGTQVIDANNALDSANETLNNVAVTLTQSSNEQIRAIALVETANSDSIAAQAQLDDANARIEVANTDVASADNLVLEANATLNGASTESAAQLATATVQIATVSAQLQDGLIQIEEANANLTQVVPTLTQASELVNDASIQVAEAEAQVLGAETQVAEAEVQIEEANEILTQVVPTLTQAGDLVISASTQVVSAETQVARANSRIATADVQNQNLQATAITIQRIAEENRIQAQSQSLIVNAEQATQNGDIDLALALLLESYELNDDLPQTRRLLNNIAYTSARFILPDASFVTFSSDSRKVAYGDGNDIVILDISSRDEIARLEGHSDTVVAGDFNFEDDLFVSGSRDSNVLVWDTSTWEIVRTLSDYGVPISDVSFDNQGNRIGAVGDKSEIVAWNLQNNYSVTVIPLNNPDTVLTEFYFLGDGSRVLAFGREGLDQVQYRVNLTNRQFARDLDGIYTTINPAYDVNAGDTPVWGMIETEPYLTVYQIVRQDQYPFGTGFNWITGEDSVGVRAFDSTGSNVIVALLNQREATNDLVLFNIGQRERSSGLEFEGAGTERVTALAYSPDGRTILSGFGRYLILWDTQTGRELRRFGTHLDDIIEISYSLDSNHAITQSRDGSYRVWDVSFSDPAVIGQISVPNSTGEFITNPGLSPDASEIYFRIANDVYRFDARKLTQNQLPFSYFGLQDVFYSRANPYLITTAEDSATSDPIARMWDASSDTPILWNNNIGGGEGETIDPIGAFSSDGQQLALSMSRFVRVYDMSNSIYNPSSPTLFDRNGMEIGALVFSPDGQYLYIAANQLEGEESYAIVRWNIVNAEQEIFPIPHIRPITSMDISDDGLQIITASVDQTVVLFDLENQTILRRMVGHQASVNEVYFGLDDEVALSASDDGSLILWDLETGQSIRRFVTGNPISGLYLSNDGKTAVSTEGTDFVTIWRIETLDDVIDWVEDNRAILPLTDEECQQFEVDCEEGEKEDDSD